MTGAVGKEDGGSQCGMDNWCTRENRIRGRWVGGVAKAAQKGASAALQKNRRKQ